MAKKKTEEAPIIKPEVIINNVVLDDPHLDTQANEEEIPTPPLVVEEKVDLDENILLYYVDEFLLSIDGIFIGGLAAQKRDQLYEYLQKYKLKNSK